MPGGRARSRPRGCCPPRVVAPLDERDRAGWTALFKALSDPNRLEILRLLGAQTGPLCACDIAACFELSQPTVSHHLRVLRDAGLVEASRSGIWAFYALSEAGRTRLADALGLVCPSAAAAR